MDLLNIINIEKKENYGGVIFAVKLKNGTDYYVPNDINNKDFLIVKEWFKNKQIEL